MQFIEVAVYAFSLTSDILAMLFEIFVAIFKMIILVPECL